MGNEKISFLRFQTKFRLGFFLGGNCFLHVLTLSHTFLLFPTLSYSFFFTFLFFIMKIYYTYTNAVKENSSSAFTKLQWRLQLLMGNIEKLVKKMMVEWTKPFSVNMLRTTKRRQQAWPPSLTDDPPLHIRKSSNS